MRTAQTPALSNATRQTMGRPSQLTSHTNSVELEHTVEHHAALGSHTRRVKRRGGSLSVLTDRNEEWIRLRTRLLL